MSHDAIAPIPHGPYGAILADPPWRFKTWSAKGRDRCPETRHYETMTLDDICATTVPSGPDCVLFLWAVDSMLPLALEVGAAWGFKYKTVAFYWVKQSESGKYPIGTGYWTRTNPEQCLLFTKGKPKRLSAAVRKLIVAPRREHSRKPDQQYSRIEALVPGPYLELFARKVTPNWDSWGAETGKFDS